MTSAPGFPAPPKKKNLLEQGGLNEENDWLLELSI